jgi:hypothetical protein
VDVGVAAECLLSLLGPGREPAETDAASEEEDEDSKVALAEIREDRQIGEEARRIVGARMLAEVLIVLRKRAEIGNG